MEQPQNRSSYKLWLGYGVMCVACVLWLTSLNWVMGSVNESPMVRVGATPAEIEAALADRDRPEDMVSKMMLGYGVSGMVFLAGAILTVLGMIDYASNTRARTGHAPPP